MTDRFKMDGGYTEVSSIGDGIAARFSAWRIHRAFPHLDRVPLRRTSDRWHRRFMAEHTGAFDYLGGTKRWTRTGAFIAHQRLVDVEQAIKAAVSR